MSIATIELGATKLLQERIESAWNAGAREFELVGTYQPNERQYALLRIGQRMSGIVIKGSGVLDGGGLASHVVVIEDANVTIEGIEISGGDTTEPKRVVKDYNGKPFRSVYEAIDGAGILILGQSVVHLVGCQITNNHSGMCGGGLSNQGTGLVEVRNCIFKGNTAYDTGGAIDNLTSNAEIIVEDSEFKDNLSDAGLAHGGQHGQITIFKKTKASLHNNVFSGETYAIDSAVGSTIDNSDNIYEGKPAKPKQSNQNKGFSDQLRHLKHSLAFKSRLLLRYGMKPFVRS